MTVVENIVRSIQHLSVREQIEVARYLYRMDKEAPRRRDEMLKRTHGALDDVDGEIFEKAMNDARRLEKHD